MNPTDVDCLIIATAIERNLKIITRNIKYYPEKELLTEFPLNELGYFSQNFPQIV